MFINVNLFEISVGIKSGSRGDFMVKMSLNVNLMLLAFIPTKKNTFPSTASTLLSMNTYTKKTLNKN